MTINFNISPALFKRLVEAIESLATNYEKVHSLTLAAIDSVKSVDKSVGRTYYQSDAAIFEDELKEKQRKAIEYGDGE